MDNFLTNYKQSLTSLINNIDNDIVLSIINELDNVEKKGKIYIIGNGGSAATASHMANDLGIGLKIRGIRNFNVESLSDNSSVCTCIANDIGYENIFYAQIKNKIMKDDIVIAISCSGNSSNIIKAISYAKEVGSKIIGITGFDGGELKSVSDISFHVNAPKGEYGLVEDIHMILDHMIYSYYISLKPETKSSYTMD